MTYVVIVCVIVVWSHIHETHRRQMAEAELARLRVVAKPRLPDNGITIDHR